MITVLWFLSVNVKMRPCFKKKKKKAASQETAGGREPIFLSVVLTLLLKLLYLENQFG